MRVRLLLALLILLLPGLSLAANIKQLNSNIIVNDDLSVFRYRDNPGIWQKSIINADEISDIRVFSQKIYAVTESSNGFQLTVSDNGLAYAPIWQTSQPITVFINNQQLMAIAEHKMKVVNQTGIIKDYDLPAYSYDHPEDYLAVADDLPIFANVTPAGIDIYDLAISSTVPKWSFNCVESYFFKAPQIIVGCDQTVWKFAGNQFDQLLNDVGLVDNNSDAILWQEVGGNTFSIYDGQTVTALSFSTLEQSDTIQLVGERLFWRKIDGLYEVSWRSEPINVVQLPSDGQLRNVSVGVVVEDSALYYSASFGSWQITNLPIQDLEIMATAHGNLAYTPDGSFTAIESQPGDFTVMNDTWASSSKIKTLAELDDGLLLVLRNSSNNPNIYQSSDYLEWHRLTMPSNPTFIATVSQARQLPANSLVEIFGKISVLPGWVSDSIAYLADSTGAMQIYLSPSKGQLVVGGYKTATAIGKISSSQVGRVILDELTNLVTGSTYHPVLSVITVSQAKLDLGGSGLIQGKISNLSTDSATITDKTDKIKLHFQNIKDIFESDDQIKISIVSDYNTSSHQVEAWYTGQSKQLISRSNVNEPVATSTANSTKSSVVSSSTSQTIANNDSSYSNRPMPSTADYQQASSTKIASTQQKNSQLPQGLTFLAGLVVGGLVIRGSRFRNFTI